jgi:hypothetical protein
MWMRGYRVAARRWSSCCGVALGAIALAGCGARTPVARGFGSREVLPIRDPTFGFTGWGYNTIFYATGDDGGDTSESIVFGPQPDAGPPAGDAGSVVQDIYSCQPGVDAQGNFATAIITNNLTGQQTTVDGVSSILQCPGADSTLTILRPDANGVLTLWSGPFDALQQVPLPVTIAELVSSSYGSGEHLALVLASPPAQPGALGLFSIDSTTFAVTMVVPPTLGTAAWASGATATASDLSSASLSLPRNSYLSLVSSVGTHYTYPRTMGDGTTIMFAGPFPSGPASELAIFAITPSVSFLSETSGMESWVYEDPATENFSLFSWDDGNQQFVSCSLPASIGGIETESNDGTKVLVGASLPSIFGGSVGAGGPLALVSLATAGQGGSDTCTLVAPANVVYAGFSSDSSAIFWVVYPTTGNQQLWTAAADGSGARMIGSAGSITQPHFAVGTELEFELEGDLMWVDSTDPQNHLHYIAEQIFGNAIDLQGSWLVVGYDLSAQDGTGSLGLINRDTGAKLLIAPEVAQYEPGDSTFGIAPGAIPGIDAGGVPYAQIAYLVRGRNPSPQDGVWVATISESDLQ